MRSCERSREGCRNRVCPFSDVSQTLDDEAAVEGVGTVAVVLGVTIVDVPRLGFIGV